jgi:hypothetical protein
LCTGSSFRVVFSPTATALTSPARQVSFSFIHNVSFIPWLLLRSFSLLKFQLVVGAHACHPSTQEAEAGGSRVQGQPGLHSETLSPRPQKKMCWGCSCVCVCVFVNCLEFIVLLGSVHKQFSSNWGNIWPSLFFPLLPSSIQSWNSGSV